MIKNYDKIVQEMIKMKKLILLPLLLTLLLFAGCNMKTTSIKNGNLILKVDNHLRTAIKANEKLQTPLSFGNTPSEYLVVDGHIITDFKRQSFSQKKIKDSIGNGTAYSFTGLYKANGLSIEKHLTIKVYNDFSSMALFDVKYINKGKKPVTVKKWVNNHYRILQNSDTVFWSFQGQSTEARADWIRPVKQGFYQRNYMGMNNSDYGGGIPVSDVWRRDIGVAVGHTSPHPELVSIPVSMENSNYAAVDVEKSFKETYELKTGEELSIPETFVLLHHGDAFSTLQEFSLLMQKKGIQLTKSPETAYEPVWCAWGYERKFTEDEVIGTLPMVKELGIKWAVIDDGYQMGEGDWNVDPKRFPAGNKAMKQMVRKIHDNGLKAKLWWAPLALDPGTPLWKNHYRDILLFNEDTSPRFITWWDAYYMSPLSDLTYSETKKVLDLFFDEWGFDGLKMDGQHMNNVPPDYNWKINHDNPELAPQKLPDFFKMVYKTGLAKKKDVVIENCPCGCCMNFYNLQGINQAVSSDPTSSWQIRLKGKVYHALNPDLAYYGDHVELSDHGNDFATSFGVGAVLGTKFTWPKDNPYADGSYLLTPEKEKVWKKWFGLYNNMMLSKGDYLGNLYDIGFDKPETHVIKKDDVLYYAFYADHWEGVITLKGLDKSKSYQVYDYVNNKVITTLPVGLNTFVVRFDGSLLVALRQLDSSAIFKNTQCMVKLFYGNTLLS